MASKLHLLLGLYTHPLAVALTGALVTTWCAAALWWSFAVGTWNNLGDTCIFCGAGAALALRIPAAVLLGHCVLQLVATHYWTSPGPRSDTLPSLLPSPTRRASSPLLSLWRVPPQGLSKPLLLLSTAVLALYWAVVVAFTLRLQQVAGLRPCPYTTHTVTPDQRALLQFDPASVYVLFHAEGYAPGMEATLVNLRRSFATRHGYSFVTSRELFGSAAIEEWNATSPLVAQADLSGRSRVWGKTALMYHVLFEAQLSPPPKWVLWVDADAVLARPEVGVESFIFGLCSHRNAVGAITQDRQHPQDCSHGDWAPARHEAVFAALRQGQVLDGAAVSSVPHFIASSDNGASGFGLNSGVLLAASTDWVKSKLSAVFLKPRHGARDQVSYNSYLNLQSHPMHVRVLPTCMGMNGYTSNWGPGRWQWGDWAAHAIGYATPAKKHAAVAVLAEVAAGRLSWWGLPWWLHFV